MIPKKVLILLLFLTSFTSIPPNKPFVYEVSSSSTEDVIDVDYEQICYIESHNKDSVVSSEGAIGAMQLMPSAIVEWNQYHPDKKYKVKDLYKREINLEVGKWFFSERIPVYLKQAKVPLKLNYKLIAYNWGSGNLIKWYKAGHDYSKLPNETRNYLAKYWEKY